MYQINKNLSDRINILKFISIIMVVFIHSYTKGVNYNDDTVVLMVPDWLQLIKFIVSQAVSRVAVPLFFLISSFLLYSKEFTWKSNIKKKCKSILLPYFIWNTFWIIFYKFAQSISITAPYFCNDNYQINGFGLVDWIKAYTYFISNAPFLYTLWFLRDLFILNIFSLIIKKTIDKLPVLTLIIIILLWFSGISIPYMDNQAIIFFALGYYIVKYNLNVIKCDKINWYLIIPIYIMFITFDYLYSNYFTVLHSLNIIIGIIFFIKLSKVITKKNKLKNIILNTSKYTFFIYAFHEMNLTIARKIIIKVLPQTGLIQLIEYFVIPIIIILFCIFVGYIFNKISPKGYKLVTGGRQSVTTAN